MYILYFAIIILIPLFAQWKVKSAFSTYSRVANHSHISGAEVARRILDHHGLYQIDVELSQGMLSDHYDPRAKVIRLSPDVYHGYSLAAAAVASHETGHALQDKEDYSFLRIRHALVPVANISSSFSWVFILIGIFAQVSGMVLLGIIFMSGAVIFQIVTLPVEFNASNRAMDEVVSLGIIRNEEERNTRKVLNAAALTYVAAAAVAILELLRLVLIYSGMRREE
jgi:uncharacterized protein